MLQVRVTAQIKVDSLHNSTAQIMVDSLHNGTPSSSKRMITDRRDPWMGLLSCSGHNVERYLCDQKQVFFWCDLECVGLLIRIQSTLLVHSAHRCVCIPSYVIIKAYKLHAGGLQWCVWSCVDPVLKCAGSSRRAFVQTFDARQCKVRYRMAVFFMCTQILTSSWNWWGDLCQPYVSAMPLFYTDVCN